MKHSSSNEQYAIQALFVLLVAWTFWQAPEIASIRFTDFDYYFQASTRLQEGKNIYYNENAGLWRPEVPSWYLYPPYLAGLIYPLIFLEKETAKFLYTILAITALIGIDLLLLRLRRRLYPRALIVDILIHLLVFLPYPTRLLLNSLQIEGLLFLLFLTIVLLTIHGKSAWKIGTAYATGVLIKLWPAPYLISLFASLRFRILIPIFLTGLSIVILLTPIIGIDSQLYFMWYILPPLTSYSDFYIDNQSVLACIRRFAPQFEIVYPFFRLFLLIMYSMATFLCRKNLAKFHGRSIAINASLFVSTSILFSATVWTAAHIRLLLPLMLGACISVEKNKKSPLILVATCISIILYCYPQSYAPTLIPFILIRDYPLLMVALIQFLVMLCLHWKYRSKETV